MWNSTSASASTGGGASRCAGASRSATGCGGADRGAAIAGRSPVTTVMAWALRWDEGRTGRCTFQFALLRYQDKMPLSRGRHGRSHRPVLRWGVPTMIDADYLVVGAGATGMAFTDALVDHAEVRVALVD